jgi:hypothetical protein
MASKRILKKNLLKMVIDVVEESYSIQLYNPKKEKATDKVIEDVLDFHDEMRSKLKQAKNKKEVAPLRKKIEEKAISYIEQVNGLY